MHCKLTFMIFIVCIYWFTYTILSMKLKTDKSRTSAEKYINQLTILGENVKDITNGYTRRKVLTRTTYPIVLTKPYKINNEGICRNVTKLSCIVIVHTSPRHFNRRNIMRETWLNSSYYNPESIRVVFLLGQVSNISLQMKIEHENSVFKDIVQGHFIDSYHNLTNKGVMGLKWITEYCQNAEFIVKIDDDVFVNFFKVFSEMSQIRNKKKYIACNRLDAGTNYIQRETYGKWYVHKDEFKRMRYYPYTSCSGLVVFISRDLVPLLYTAAFMSPFFWVDDMYLFGILPAKINGVIHQKLNMNLTLNHTQGLECYEKFGTQCHFAVSLIIPEKDNVTCRSWEAILRTRK